MSNDPSPSAETPEQLIAQWRTRQLVAGQCSVDLDAPYAAGEADAVCRCADELEALLRRGRSALPSPTATDEKTLGAKAQYRAHETS